MASPHAVMKRAVTGAAHGAKDTIGNDTHRASVSEPWSVPAMRAARARCSLAVTRDLRGSKSLCAGAAPKAVTDDAVALLTSAKVGAGENTRDSARAKRRGVQAKEDLLRELKHRELFVRRGKQELRGREEAPA